MTHSEQSVRSVGRAGDTLPWNIYADRYLRLLFPASPDSTAIPVADGRRTGPLSTSRDGPMTGFRHRNESTSWMVHPGASGGLQADGRPRGCRRPPAPVPETSGNVSVRRAGVPRPAPASGVPRKWTIGGCAYERRERATVSVGVGGGRSGIATAMRAPVPALDGKGLDRRLPRSL